MELISCTNWYERRTLANGLEGYVGITDDSVVDAPRNGELHTEPATPRLSSAIVGRYQKADADRAAFDIKAWHDAGTLKIPSTMTLAV